MKLSTATLLSSLILGQAAMAVVSYQIDARNSDTGVKFSIPYKFGTHKGSVAQIQGEVQMTESDEVLKAHFEVPISSMSTGNNLRDCHMREALGIDYTISKFPKDHVCEFGNPTLPVSGPDSVHFPWITVDGEKIQSTEPFVLNVPKAMPMTFNIQVHGVTKAYQADNVTITKMADEKGIPSYRIQTRLVLSLKDFGVIVKPVPVLGGVSDQATVEIDTKVSGS